MKSRMLLLLLLLISNCGYATENVKLQVKKIPESNMLKNAVFATAKGKEIPTSWFFNNYSKDSGFRVFTKGKIFNIETTGDLYGYLAQPNIPVIEGKKYYVEIKVRLTSRALLWIRTRQYDDKNSPFFPPWSQTSIYVVSNPDHGEALVDELKYFIDLDYLIPISSTKWCLRAKEFTVPVGHKITSYDYRIGSFGGKQGWIQVKDPIFSLARQKAQLTLFGKNLTTINILLPDGKIEQSFPLNPQKSKNQIDITLNSRITRYFAEIIDNTGKSYRRAL